jgi:hypothetical protein
MTVLLSWVIVLTVVHRGMRGPQSLSTQVGRVPLALIHLADLVKLQLGLLGLAHFWGHKK